MNYHYIDCMLKERRRQEAEECKRLQLLKAAGYGNTSLAKELLSRLKNKAELLKSWLTHYTRQSDSISIAACGSAGNREIGVQAKRGQRLFCTFHEKGDSRSK